ncbi:MAG: choloylglycine hydrolase [Clostridia bacterium]|nr:choloylglycine hydrolase [Clostridia bacterium]
MCTAVVFGRENRFFGRNLDLEVGFGESVIVTPRRYDLAFRYMPNMKRHAALIGTGIIMEGYPLYFEATNEQGLSMAGLNFVGNCHYSKMALDMCDNVCQFELIPHILGRCSSVFEARRLINKINLVKEPFCEELALPELHWIISDEKDCIVLEITEEGTRVFNDPYSVLTNNPPFEYHLNNICNYQSLSASDPAACFGKQLSFSRYSRGMGAIGLPGDWSSASRFVRAAFVRANAIGGGNVENEENGEREGALPRGVLQLFHILSSVAMPYGCVAVGEKYEYTRYTSCCDVRTGEYYFKRYFDPCIRKVAMKDFDLDREELYSLLHGDCRSIC